MEKIMKNNTTYIQVFNTDIKFTMEGNPTYPEMIRYAIQNNIPITYTPTFTITRSEKPTDWSQIIEENNL
jgi:hypothetical protein|tara:strand:- start:253 stop:462 length:210 start_codon:yes stop_codon:yes gene_type:complete